MSYDNTNSFVLFKNDKKSDKQPDYTGTLTLEDGTEKRIAAWIREGKKGKFMSGKISEPMEHAGKPKTEPKVTNTGDEWDDMNDPIPF